MLVPVTVTPEGSGRSSPEDSPAEWPLAVAWGLGLPSRLVLFLSLSRGSGLRLKPEFNLNGYSDTTSSGSLVPGCQWQRPPGPDSAGESDSESEAAGPSRGAAAARPGQWRRPPGPVTVTTLATHTGKVASASRPRRANLKLNAVRRKGGRMGVGVARHLVSSVSTLLYMTPRNARDVRSIPNSVSTFTYRNKLSHSRKSTIESCLLVPNIQTKIVAQSPLPDLAQLQVQVRV